MKTRGFLVFGVALIILGLVGGIIGMSMLDWKFSKLDEQFEPQVYEVTEEVTSLDFDLDSFDVTILRGTAFKVDYNTSDRTTFDIKVEEGVLKVVEDYNWRHRFMNIFGWINNKFRNIILTVPQDINFGSVKVVGANSEITIDGVNIGTADFGTTNGDIELSNLSYTSLNMSTTNGGFSAENINGGDISFTTTNDDITINGSKAGKVSLKTTNGEIEVKNSEFVEFGAKTTNGEIESENVVSSKYRVETTNGKVYATRLKADDIYLKSTNGRIEASIVGILSEYKIVVYTTNGDTNLNNADGSVEGKIVDAHTTNGDVIINFI